MRSAQWDGDRSSVLGRALSILGAFEGQDELRLTELATRSGLPKATAHRIVTQFVHREWLERDGPNVRLGVRLFELGSMVSYNRDLREAAIPFMADLFEATHEAVHLAVRAGLEVLYIEKITGHRMVPVPTRIGGRMPLHCTGLGKALLAYAPVHILDAVIEHGLLARTEHSITTPDDLRRDLAAIKRTGVAYDMEESTNEIRCVAAPVFGMGDQLAAISVTVSTRRPLQPSQLAPAVRTAALGVTSMLGCSRPPLASA
jgi:IclR family transcriptional regulator, acetate operon repressor